MNWVLGKIRKEEQEDFQKAVENARDAALFSIKNTFIDTMSRYNKK